MKATAHHHCGLRVIDIDRAARFYIDAFDGHFLAMPFPLEGDFAETVMEGPGGVAFKVCVPMRSIVGLTLADFPEADPNRQEA